MEPILHNIQSQVTIMSRIEKFFEDVAEDTWKYPEELNQKLTTEQLKGITKSDSGIHFIEVDYGQVEYQNKRHHLKGKFPIFHPVEFYGLPSCEEINFVLNWIREFFINNELIFEHEIKKLKNLKAVSHGTFLVFIFSRPQYEGRNYEYHEKLLTVLLSVLVIMVDDVFEELEIHDIGGHQKAIKEMYKKYYNANSLHEIKVQFPDFTPPILIAYSKAFRKALTGSTHYNGEHVTYFEQRNQHAKRAILDVFISAVTLHSIDWADETDQAKLNDTTCNGKINTNGFKRERKTKMPEKPFLTLKRTDNAMLATLETSLLSMKIVLEEDLRENIWFKQLTASYMAMNEYANAIVGILRDLEKDQISSITYKAKVKGCPLEQAFKSILQQYGEEMEAFVYAQSELITEYPDSEELQKIMDLMERFVDSVAYLQMYAFRFGDIRYAFVK